MKPMVYYDKNKEASEGYFNQKIIRVLGGALKKVSESQIALIKKSWM